jgi:hypothetical protein
MHRGEKSTFYMEKNSEQDERQTFQFDIVKNCDVTSTIYVRDITEILDLQYKHSSLMFQNAVEANFSHEQMTPLNSIQNNAEITQNQIDQIVNLKKETKSPKELLKALQKFFKLCQDTN